jgi:phenylalanyl-tRNA synthetase beta chain
VFDAKGLAIELVERLTGLTAEVKVAVAAPHLHPRGAAELWIGGEIVGSFGPLHPDIVDTLDLEGSALVLELDLVALEQLGRRTPRYSPIARLPAVTRDISLTVRDDVNAGAVASVIRDAAGDLCESVQLFDLFRGGAIPENHRSLAFRLIYRDPRAASDPEKARTLTDKEVDERHARVVKAAAEGLGGMLRA